ncbi:hypothetical protein Tco_0250777 [Tanacetum coccineum]
MAAEVPQTLEYRGGQLNDAPLLEVENFTNWKNMFMCHITSIEPQFEKIIKMVTISLWKLVKGSLKYNGQQMRESIYDNENKKALTTVTPVSTAFISTSIIQDFQDSPDDEEDTRSSQEYLNDLEKEYQTKALLAKIRDSSKRRVKDLVVQRQVKILNATNVAKMITLQETVSQKL